jgi:DNA-binding Xre family transcriptional regulator
MGIDTIKSETANYTLLLDAINELKQKGWDDNKLAEKINISQSNFYNLLTNTKDIDHVTLKKYMLNLDKYLDE